MRHQRGDADAEHLRDGEHDERQVPGDRHAGDRLLAEPADPVEIDQEVQRLKDHGHQHEAGRFQQMPRDRPGGEVLHGESTVTRKALWSQACRTLSTSRDPASTVHSLESTGPRAAPSAAASKPTHSTSLRCRSGFRGDECGFRSPPEGGCDRRQPRVENSRALSGAVPAAECGTRLAKVALCGDFTRASTRLEQIRQPRIRLQVARVFAIR